jgi:capsular polysaccharide biosynthesis protein
MTTEQARAEHYRQLFSRQWWIIAVCALGVAAGSFLGSRFLTSTTPTYSSTALVEAQFIGTYNDTNGYMSTEAKLCTSSKILSAIIGNYPGLSESALASKITAVSVTGTHLVQITVTDTNSARAAKIANDIANALIADQQQLSQQFGSQAIQQIQSQLSAIQNQINQASNSLGAALQSGNQSSITSLESQLSSLREQQALLEFSLAQMQVALSEGTPTLSIAQQGVPSTTPVRSLVGSSAKYAAGGMLVGLALGVGLILVLDLGTRRQVGSTVAEPIGVSATKP